MKRNVQKSPLRIQLAKAGLVVVDIQERLLPAIFENERLVQNAARLIKGATILGLPLFATEQYRKGLGPTVPEIAAAIPGFSPIEKLAFSACGAKDFISLIKSKKVSDIILCGMESHVCILQTCLDLLAMRYRVFVVADAISSRTQRNYQLGLERMRDAGAVMVSAEMVLLELLEKAGTEEFRQILSLVK